MSLQERFGTLCSRLGVEFLCVSIPNPPLYRLKKNGLGVTSLSKSVLSLFYLVLWEQFFPVYWSLQGRYFFECGS